MTQDLDNLAMAAISDCDIVAQLTNINQQLTATNNHFSEQLQTALATKVALLAKLNADPTSNTATSPATMAPAAALSLIIIYYDNYLLDSAYPIRDQDIYKSQETDGKLKQMLVSHKDYNLDNFCWGDQNHRLIFQNTKICLPTALLKKLWIGITRCSVILERLTQSILSVIISTGKAFTQQSATCVRSAQHAK